jgi:hypothetical protein
MMMSKMLCGRLRLLVPLALLLAGCASPATPIAAIAKPDCAAFSVLTYSKTDSDATILQIKAHNAAYRALCQS